MTKFCYPSWIEDVAWFNKVPVRLFLFLLVLELRSVIEDVVAIWPAEAHFSYSCW